MSYSMVILYIYNFRELNYITKVTRNQNRLSLQKFYVLQLDLVDEYGILVYPLKV
jgi:hypothetical protein